MVGYAVGRGGLTDSKNASNSFFPILNRAVFWDLATVIHNFLIGDTIYMAFFSYLIVRLALSCDPPFILLRVSVKNFIL